MATTKKTAKVTTAVAIDALDIDKMRNAILAANQIDVDAKNSKTTAGIERLRIFAALGGAAGFGGETTELEAVWDKAKAGINDPELKAKLDDPKRGKSFKSKAVKFVKAGSNLFSKAEAAIDPTFQACAQMGVRVSGDLATIRKESVLDTIVTALKDGKTWDIQKYAKERLEAQEKADDKRESREHAKDADPLGFELGLMSEKLGKLAEAKDYKTLFGATLLGVKAQLDAARVSIAKATTTATAQQQPVTTAVATPAPVAPVPVIDQLVPVQQPANPFAPVPAQQVQPMSLDMNQVGLMLNLLQQQMAALQNRG